jgi:hypothetical protein
MDISMLLLPLLFSCELFLPPANPLQSYIL